MEMIAYSTTIIIMSGFRQIKNIFCKYNVCIFNILIPTKINDVNGTITIIQLFGYANYMPFIGQMNRKPL